MRRGPLLLPVTCLATALLAAQTSGDADWQAAAGGKKAFDVASVKLAKPGMFMLPTFWPNNADGKPPGGHFRANFPLLIYISFAYKLDMSEGKSMSEHLPKWANDFYVIDAKADGNPSKDQMRLMMQSLLADRFKLRVHFETREGPVLALTLAEPGKLGPKLIPHSQGPPCPESFEETIPLATPPPPLREGDVFPAQCETPGATRGTSNGIWIGARNTTMGLLAQDIYAYGSPLGELDKPVVDQTGLPGRFDYRLALPAGMISLIPSPPNPDDPPKGTPFLDAVRKQLGLKLGRSRGATRMFVIDHIERPSEN